VSPQKNAGIFAPAASPLRDLIYVDWGTKTSGKTRLTGVSQRVNLVTCGDKWQEMAKQSVQPA
jgi:hypothetical protein